MGKQTFVETKEDPIEEEMDEDRKKRAYIWGNDLGSWIMRRLVSIRQFFCWHDWDNNLIPYGYGVMSMVMFHGRVKICRKCRKLWRHPSIRPIYIRWWDRLFIRFGLLQFIDPILRKDIEMDPELKKDLPSWTLR